MADVYKPRVISKAAFAAWVGGLDPARDIIVSVAPYLISESGYVLEYMVVIRHVPA